MSGYIDRDLALSMPWANGKYDHKHADEQFIFGLETYKEWLEALEPADVVEVKHGEWGENVLTKDEYGDIHVGYICSVCKRFASQRGNYCLNCGAKMDGDK